MKRRLIPFRWLPGSWGLRGRAYDEAEAHYLLDGDDLELRLIDIRHGDDKDAWERSRIKYFTRVGRMSAYESARAIAMLDLPEGHERELRLLGIELLYGRITQFEHDLARINLSGGAHEIDRLRLLLKHGKITPYEFDREAAIRQIENDDERARALVEIEFKHGKLTAFERDIQLLELGQQPVSLIERKRIEHRYGMISDHEFEQLEISERLPEGVERDIALLELDYRGGKLDKHAFEKKCATLREEPWVAVIDQGFDPAQGVNGVFFEFDWNSFWIEYLRLNGYQGHSDEQIMDQWFNDVCKATLAADGTQPSADAAYGR